MNAANLFFKPVLLQIRIEQGHSNGIFAEASGCDLMTAKDLVEFAGRQVVLVFNLCHTDPWQIYLSHFPQFAIKYQIQLA